MASSEVGGEAGAKARTKILQGWPKLWTNFRALIGIFSQSLGLSLAIWANPVEFSLCAPDHLARLQLAEHGRRHKHDLGFGRIVASDREAPNMLANLI